VAEVLATLRAVEPSYALRVEDISEEDFDELVDEDTKAELIDGVLVVHSPASPQHDNEAGFLRALMRCYAEERGLGQVFGPDAVIHLATCRKFAPDGFVLDSAQMPVALPVQEFDLTPALIFEILLPSNRNYDLNDKRPAYHKAGVREIWLIDPDEQRVIVDRRHGKRYATRTLKKGRLTSTVLRGFWLDVSWLWAEPLPNVLTCLREILGS
jgi:Uma2 family endonuclease